MRHGYNSNNLYAPTKKHKIMVDTLNSYKTDKEEVAPLPFYQRIYNKVTSWIRPGLFTI